MKLFNRSVPILLTVGIVMWLERMLTVEWTYPYCLDPSDGPAYAAQGMPLPYWMWNGVVSLEHYFLPHVYVLNIFLLSLLLFPVIRWILNRAFSERLEWLRTVVGIVGGLLLISQLSLTCFLLSTGFYHSGTSLGLEDYQRYSDFRPVRFGWIRSNAPDCTPSRFWFPKD